MSTHNFNRVLDWTDLTSIVYSNSRHHTDNLKEWAHYHGVTHLSHDTQLQQSAMGQISFVFALETKFVPVPVAEEVEVNDVTESKVIEKATVDVTNGNSSSQMRPPTSSTAGKKVLARPVVKIALQSEVKKKKRRIGDSSDDDDEDADEVEEEEEEEEESSDGGSSSESEGDEGSVAQSKKSQGSSDVNDRLAARKVIKVKSSAPTSKLSDEEMNIDDEEEVEKENNKRGSNSTKEVLEDPVLSSPPVLSTKRGRSKRKCGSCGSISTTMWRQIPAFTEQVCDSCYSQFTTGSTPLGGAAVTGGSGSIQGIGSLSQVSLGRESISRASKRRRKPCGSCRKADGVRTFAAFTDLICEKCYANLCTVGDVSLNLPSSPATKTNSDDEEPVVINNSHKVNRNHSPSGGACDPVVVDVSSNDDDEDVMVGKKRKKRKRVGSDEDDDDFVN